MIFSPPQKEGLLSWYYGHLVKELAFLPPLPGVALLPVDSQTFQPLHPEDSAEVNIGVYLPESFEITEVVSSGEFHWDLLIVPLYWLEYQLRIRGVTRVLTIPPGWESGGLPEQGSGHEECPRYRVAVSGLFSYRQGSDLALTALRSFLQRHQDAELVCSWEFTTESLKEISRYSHKIQAVDTVPWQTDLFLSRNGVAPGQVLFAPPGTLQPSDADLYIAPMRVPAVLAPDLRRFIAAGKAVIAPNDNASPLGMLELEMDEFPAAPILAPDQLTIWREGDPGWLIDSLEAHYTRWSAGYRQGASSAGQPGWRDRAEQLMKAAGDSCLGRPLPALTPYCWNKRGVVLGELGEYQAAHKQYQQALALNPHNPETHNCIGNLFDAQGEFQEAINSFDRALLCDRRFMAALFNKANALKQLGKFEEATELYQQVLSFDPRFITGWLNLGVAYGLQEQLEQSELCFRKVIELDPVHTDALLFLGNQLMGQKRFEEAQSCFFKIISVEPEHYLAYNSSGIVWLSTMEPEKAYHALSRALMLKPDLTSAMCNIGTACRDMERLDEAVFWFRKALTYNPDDADAHWNLSLALLHRGDYREGWLEYEWRFKKSEQIQIPRHDIPLWCGDQSLVGRSILLQAEQGYGDTIQFTRYAKLVADYGAQVIVECQDDNLKPLLAEQPYITRCFSWSDRSPVQADFSCPLMSLPHLLQTDLSTIPFPEGYLSVSPEKIQQFRYVLDKHLPAGSFRVGIAWDGRKTFRNDHRSCRLADLRQLLSVDRARFVSIQKDMDPNVVEELQQHGITSLSNYIHDFSDTAALIKNLDLVIAVDTSVAHLAGALGVPVWIMLKTGPDWRWLHNRCDSPWYEAARLFRQQTAGNWSSVLLEIVDKIKLIDFCQ